MDSFFQKTGPYNINQLIKFTKFSEKKKFENNIIKNVSNLKDAKKGDITFLENSRYLSELENTKASYCLIEKKYFYLTVYEI